MFLLFGKNGEVSCSLRYRKESRAAVRRDRCKVRCSKFYIKTIARWSKGPCGIDSIVYCTFSYEELVFLIFTSNSSRPLIVVTSPSLKAWISWHGRDRFHQCQLVCRCSVLWGLGSNQVSLSYDLPCGNNRKLLLLQPMSGEDSM